MKRFCLLVVLLISQGSRGDQESRLPEDVLNYIVQRERCDHWRGEVLGTPEASLIQQVNQACQGTDESLTRLKSKYRNHQDISAKLDSYETRIERRNHPDAD